MSSGSSNPGSKRRRLLDAAGQLVENATNDEVREKLKKMVAKHMQTKKSNIRNSWIAFGVNDASKHLQPKVFKKMQERNLKSLQDSDDEEDENRSNPIVTRIDGQEVQVQDYGLNWADLDEHTRSSTHEITFSKYHPNHIWISGMIDNQLARVDVTNPAEQEIFKFQLSSVSDGQPHTICFDDSEKGQGAMWVGLEYAGLIVKIDMSQDRPFKRAGSSFLIDDERILDRLDVRIHGKGIRNPLNTHPHGFCLDAKNENIWFTGKLTNTVGRVNIATKIVEHFQLPTLGAVPIYVVLGHDDNIWGTCLANNNVFRVTTGANPSVLEIPITPMFSNRRPIAIKKGPLTGTKRYMWFSEEAGHKVARIDVDRVIDICSGDANPASSSEESEIDAHGETVYTSVGSDSASASGPAPGADKGTERGCSCSSFFYAANRKHGVVEEFDVPMTQRNMIMAGLAFDNEGNLWTQSYVDQTNPEPVGPDFIVKIDRSISRALPGKITNIPIKYFEVPTRRTILHRIICGPDGRMWFTQLGQDRVGVVTLEKTK